MSAPVDAVELMRKGWSDEDIAIKLNMTILWVATIRRNTILKEES